MATCKENCFCYSVCTKFEAYARNPKLNLPNPSECIYFKDRSKFTELKSAQWVKHKPDIEKMREFHRLGIGKAMSEKSIFWTCSICGSWGNLSQKYCSSCGAKMEENSDLQSE